MNRSSRSVGGRFSSYRKPRLRVTFDFHRKLSTAKRSKAVWVMLLDVAGSVIENELARFCMNASIFGKLNCPTSVNEKLLMNQRYSPPSLIECRPLNWLRVSDTTKLVS